MTQQIDIHKAGAVIIRDRKLLVSRSRGKEAFYAPGGKLEPGETASQALVRELKEEQAITVSETDIRLMGSFMGIVPGTEDKVIQMDMFYVDNFEGELTPSAEIEENRWVDSQDTSTPQGSIFVHEVIPRLKADGLID